MYYKFRHAGSRALINKIYGPLRGLLTTGIDFLSRRLLLTLKSMAINTQLLFTVCRPAAPRKTFKCSCLTSRRGL